MAINRIVNTDEPIMGGCLCKKIKFKSNSKPKWISVCHCRMCQKAYGNTSAVFVAFEKGTLEFISGSQNFIAPLTLPERGLRGLWQSNNIFL